MSLRASVLRRALQQSKSRRGGTGFGTNRDHEPAWIENWSANTRQGKDSMDWFFRAFNKLGLYEMFLKSSPRFYGFMVCGGIIGGYYWSRMWDHYWAYTNRGRIYKDCPYVYPPEEEDE
eukprot:TRINITY_DN332_c0_g2_i1.p1 TRINITY_DN332_c0_g2~~TRINITY_DN332_c0_g2_i1.p1  ORF type:complete len:119 (+),score=23.14 TRINITY_DN332_c0_g2_i1:67-423(+)